MSEEKEPRKREPERCCCIHFYNALRRKLIVIDEANHRVTIPIADRGKQFQDFQTIHSPWSSKELFIVGCPWCRT
jgi:hypothetical protein